MKKRYKVLFSLAGIIAFLLIGIYSGLLSAGSYPYSENYKFHADSDRLVKAIKMFKKNNPGYNVPGQVGLVDTVDDNKIFYNFWIYYQQQNEIAFFIVEGNYNDIENSTLRLISINHGLTLGQWGTINDDIKRRENLDQKKRFQTEVLNKLKLDYKDDGNSMFVFWK